MSKFLFERMSRITKIVEKSLKITNFDPFMNIYTNNLEFKTLGMAFPSSRMNVNYNILKKPVVTVEKSNEVIDKNFSDLERIIGLDFPYSRFK